MMATRLAPRRPRAAPQSKPFTRGSSSRPMLACAGQPSRFSRPQACASRPSADLAGRAVTLSAAVPASFDAPLAPHHVTIGRWVAAREAKPLRYTRQDARRRIEQVFNDAVVDILSPFDLADLRVVALHGDGERPPALAIICDTVGQIELGWIGKANVLSNTLFGRVAPVGWRAAAYQALEQSLPDVLPIFGYHDFIEELSAYYWDGATDDDGARAALIHIYGEEEVDQGEMTLPSQLAERRPDWMTAKAAPLKDMPKDLQAALRRLRDAQGALKAAAAPGNAWRLDSDQYHEYCPDAEDHSYLPPMTLLPFEQFARELDDVGRMGMETGFMDCAGLCPLADPGTIDAWFASLRAGAELLLAAQHLINLYPTTSVKP